MDELSLKKTALERRLKQGEENITALTAKLERSNEIAGSMCGILDSFNERLHKLEDTIRPIHDETTKLKRLQGNVDRTLSAIDKVIAFHSLPEEVEGRIQEGEKGDICGAPGSVDKFLKVMDRLRSAIDFFKKSRIQSVESTTTVTLYERGLRALAKDFRNQLARASSVSLPLPTLMDMVEQPAHEEPPPVEQLQERLVEDLAAIANYLSSQKVKLEEDFLSVYSQYRSNQLRKSLTQLKEASQFTAMAPVPAQRRGTITNLLKMESPAKMKTSKTKSAPKAASSASMLKEGQEDELEGCTLFLATTKVFMRLMQSEQSLMTAILPPEHRQEVFDRLTQTAFEQFIRRGEDLHQRAKRELGRQNTAAILSVCKVVREMRELEKYYAFLMAELPSRNFSRYTVLVAKFEALNLGALDDFVISVKSDPEKHSQSMPKDGTVHEFTSNTMAFLEQLLEYQDVMGRCLASGNRSGMPKLADMTERDMTGLLGQYLCQVTNALCHNLEGKSKTYDSSTLQALFLLNNYHFMHSVFQRNARMMSLLEVDDPRVEKKYIALVEAQLTNYRKCFNHVASHITPTSELQALAQQGKGEKLHKNQRQMLKDKFKAFNMEMDELTKIQRSYAIPDTVLRTRVKQGNADFLLRKYNEFYANFSQTGFTQHPEKYLKYTPQSLEVTLNTFFDLNA